MNSGSGRSVPIIAGRNEGFEYYAIPVVQNRIENRRNMEIIVVRNFMK